VTLSNWITVIFNNTRHTPLAQPYDLNSKLQKAISRQQDSKGQREYLQ
jgi:hypothetical protein